MFKLNKLNKAYMRRLDSRNNRLCIYRNAFPSILVYRHTKDYL